MENKLFRQYILSVINMHDDIELDIYDHWIHDDINQHASLCASSKFEAKHLRKQLEIIWCFIAFGV